MVAWAPSSPRAWRVIAADIDIGRAPAGVRVNAVAPGVILTELVRPMRDVPGGLDWYTSRVPFKRCGEPEEVVGPVVFLCSPMASYINGVVLPVDGGFLSA